MMGGLVVVKTMQNGGACVLSLPTTQRRSPARAVVEPCRSSLADAWDETSAGCFDQCPQGFEWPLSTHQSSKSIH